MKQNENGQSAAKLEWRVIDEVPVYEVSNNGLVRRIKTGRILKFCNRKRYYTVALHNNGIRKDRYVHRLVALAFLPNPKKLRYVNHKDHNIHNNNIENLEWCSSSENARHSYENDRRKEEYQQKRAHVQRIMTQHTKKPVEQWTSDYKHLIAVFNSQAEASQITGISEKNISKCVCGNSKNAGGYGWKRYIQEGSTTKRLENPTKPAHDTETSDDIV